MTQDEMHEFGDEGREDEGAESGAARPSNGKAEAAVAAEAPRSDKLRWYVVHTYSGHENKVKQSIEKAVELQGLGHLFDQVLIPMEEVTEMKKGKKVKVNRKFFP